MAKRTYEETLVAATKKLWEVADNPKSSPRDYELALENAHKALTRLRKDPDFLSDLKAAVSNPNAQNAFGEVALSAQQFGKFFSWERAQLIDNGLPAALVEAIASESETIRVALAQTGPPSVAAVLATIDELAERFAVGARYARGANLDRELAQRGTQALAGISAITINAKFLVGELVIPGVSIITSIGVGLFVAQDTLTKEPVLKRLVSFFKKPKRED
jgi:hypothetical protein